MNRSQTLRISEIFYSLQGETSRIGLPTVFIRLTGCPLRCTYCDSKYAYTGGRSLSLDEVLAKVAQYGAHYVCVTGGEPLAQTSTRSLLTLLADAGYSVSLETSGAMPVDEIDARISRIVDIKTPGSGEVAQNRWDNLRELNMHDEIKFVLCDRADYEWACGVLRERGLEKIAPVIFSPVWETLKPVDLANWVVQDRLPVRVQVQLHKILWGDRAGV